MTPDLSIVVPVYGCAGCLDALHARIEATVTRIGATHEIVYVDDGSRDGAEVVLDRLVATKPAVRAVRLSRNFGQHAAITAGLATARGRWTVVMDCDLQDPPEHIETLYRVAREGFDVVVSRRSRRAQSLARRIVTRGYYRLYRTLVHADMDTNLSNMSMLSRKVVDAYLKVGDRDRQYLLIVFWLGFRRAYTEIEAADRPDGRSSYSWRKLLQVALDGLFFQTTRLLRWVIYTGFFIAAAGVLLAGYALAVFTLGGYLPQWTALPILILIVTGFAVVSTGVSGLYVGKIFEQVKGRPLYVIDTIDESEAGSSRPLGDQEEKIAASGGVHEEGEMRQAPE